MSTFLSQCARTALSVTGWTLAAAIVLTALTSVSSAPSTDWPSTDWSSTDWSSTDWRISADWSRTVPAGLESAELKDTSTQRPDSDSLRLDKDILPGSRLFGSNLPGDSLSSDSLSSGRLSSDSFSGSGVPSSDRPENAGSVENAGSAKTTDDREGEPLANQTVVADAAADVAADAAAGTGVVKSSGETSRGAVSRGETPQGETPQGETPQGEMSQEEAQGSPTGRGSSGTGLAEAGSPEPARSPQSGQTERWETERWETKQGKTKQGNVNQGTGASPRSSTAELRGLVVDETITPQGRTFYTEFYGVWQSPPVDGFYTVEVREKPTPGRAALVRVFVNDDVTFQARLQPQTDIAERALQAARRTYGYVRSGQGILQIY